MTRTRKESTEFAIEQVGYNAGPTTWLFYGFERYPWVVCELIVKAATASFVFVSPEGRVDEFRACAFRGYDPRRRF